METNEQNPHIIFIDEPETITTYSYISNHLCFEYFVGYEIAVLLGYKDPNQTIRNNVSKCNQLIFKDYPGVRKPSLDPRTILITRDGACEILIKTRKKISPDVAHILKRFKIETTNKKCLTKEQRTLSDISNVFKTEKIEDQFKIGPYFLDLYFPEYKIIIECDENGHSDRDPEKEQTRMDFINIKLGIDDGYWIRYNPDERNFDLSQVIGRILMMMQLKGKIQTRICATCKIDKPLTEYHKNSHQKLGREYRCKVCRSSKNKERLVKKRVKTVIPDTKLCGMCNEEKLSDNFWKSIGYKDGLYKFCKPCGYIVRKKQREKFSKSDKKMKKCSTCNQIKSVKEFGNLQASSDGLQYKCCICQSEYYKLKGKNF